MLGQQFAMLWVNFLLCFLFIHFNITVWTNELGKTSHYYRLIIIVLYTIIFEKLELFIIHTITILVEHKNNN